MDEPADVLNLLLALPWLPDNDLATHVRNRLMEDLLVDLCDIEGSSRCTASLCFHRKEDKGDERPMVMASTFHLVRAARETHGRVHAGSTTAPPKGTRRAASGRWCGGGGDEAVVGRRRLFWSSGIGRPTRWA